MRIFIELGTKENQSYCVMGRKNRPFTGDIIRVKRDASNRHEKAVRIRLTAFNSLKDTYTAERAPKILTVAEPKYSAESSLSDDMIRLFDQRGEMVESFTILYKGGTIFFEIGALKGLNRVAKQILTDTLDNLRVRLFGNVIDERGLLTKAIVMLRATNKTKREDFAKQITDYLADVED
jgi:hypothetical protein